MKNQKIIIDTNVIVAASILENIKELNIQVRHDFYNPSRLLFSIFTKRPREQIGISVPTVRREAFLVLSKAVKKSMISNEQLDKHTKEVFYNNTVALVNSCEHKMRYLFSLLLTKNPNQEKVRKNFQKVKDMSIYLRELWNRKYRNQYQKERESKQRAKPIATEPKWKGEQKVEVLNTYRNQIFIESQQLERFMDKYPNLNDEWILAETLTIKEDYENIDEDYQFYIASFDMGFFSPLIRHDVKSDVVTKEIKETFHITCDRPNVIFWIVNIPSPK